MGSCAGCGNPQRKYRSQQLHKTDKNSSVQKPLTKQTNIKQSENNADEHYRIFESSLKMGMQNSKQEQKLKKSNTVHSMKTQPWKNKIMTRTISKYIKPATLKQQEQKSKTSNNGGSKQNLLSFGHLSAFHKKTIGEQSLQNEIKQLKKNDNYGNIKYNGSELSSEMKDIFGQNPQKYSKQKFKLYQEQQEQQSYERNQQFQPKRYKTYNSPVNKMELSIFSEKYDVYDLEPSNKRPKQYPISYSSSFQESSYAGRGLTIKKNNKQRTQQQLNMIKQIFQNQSQTPNYVKGLKKQYGQDIRYDGIQKFEAMPDVLPEFMRKNMNQYLEILKS